jgi:glycosyltransferase involved in cell wall biosynthesis
VALVHHPLHLESGLDEAARHSLAEQERQALQAARLVIVTSAATAVDVAQMGVPADRITVVEPGTDAVMLPALGKRRDGGPVRLLCVATLTPRKGHAVLLEALAGLTGLDWELHAVGSADRDPPTAERLRALAASLGLADRVHWHGETGTQKLASHYAEAEVFVLASWHEGYGMAVAEAMAHGLPVVCTRAGALAHTLPSDAGLQVPPGDAEALREALARLITAPELRATLAIGARRAACDLPTWPQAAARFAAVLEGVEAPARRRAVL